MLRLIFTLALAAVMIPVSAYADSQGAWEKSYALETNGKYEKAAALIAPLMEKGREKELARLRYGWLNYLQGNFNDAIRAYKEALNYNPRSFDARLGVALPLMAQQRWNEATRYLQQVLAQSPHHYLANIRLMVCEEGLRKWDSLAKHAMTTAAYYPSDASSLVYLARAYAWQGKHELAREAYQGVLTRVPGHVEASRFLNK